MDLRDILNIPLDLDNPKEWVTSTMIDIAEELGYKVSETDGFFSSVLGVFGISSKELVFTTVKPIEYMDDNKEEGVEYYLDNYPLDYLTTCDKIIQEYYETTKMFPKFGEKWNLKKVVRDVYDHCSTYESYSRDVEYIENSKQDKINKILNTSYEDII